MLYYLTAIAVLVSLVSFYLTIFVRPTTAAFTALVGIFITVWGEYEALKQGDAFYINMGTVSIVMNGVALTLAIVTMIVAWFTNRRERLWG